MKCLAFFVAICGVIGFSKAAFTEDQLQMMKRVFMDCVVSEKASKGDIDEFMAAKAPTTKASSCLHACMGETFGMFVNNRLDVEYVVDLARMALDDDTTKVNIVREVAIECANLTDADRCEAAARLYNCIHDKVNAKGVAFNP